MTLKETSLAVLLTLAAGSALAAGAPSDPSEQQAMTQATVTAAQAAAAAETSSGGRVVELSLDMHDGKPAYDVTVVAADGQETHYLVDARAGTIAPYAAAEQEPAGDDAQGEDTDDEEEQGG